MHSTALALRGLALRGLALRGLALSAALALASPIALHSATAQERVASKATRVPMETRGGPLGETATTTEPATGGVSGSFIAGPGLTMHPRTGRVTDLRGEMVAEIGPDWTHADLDAISMKYSLLEALDLRMDGRVSARTRSGQVRFVDGEVLTAVFESGRRGSAVVLALDSTGKIYLMRTPQTVSPGSRMEISLKVSPSFGEDHLLIIVGHSIALLSQTVSAMQGQPLDAVKVVDVLSALGDGSVAALAVLTSAR